MASDPKPWTQADIDAAEALGGAIADAATQNTESEAPEAAAPSARPAKKKPAKAPAKKSAKKPAPEARAGRSRKLGDWSGVDQILAFVLLANLALMGILVLTGGEQEPAQKPSPTGTEPPEQKEELFPFEERSAEPEQEPSGPKTGRVPVIPRNALWDEAIRQAALGDVRKGIQLLEQLLQEDAGMQGVVRRTVYQQLAYYYGLAGEPERSRHFQVLATRGHMIGLTPAQLWKLAEEATALNDRREARAFYARFLLQEARMDEEHLKKIPLAHLRLGDSYRDEANTREVSEEVPGESPTVPAGAGR